jgi:hypothetical protein
LALSDESLTIPDQSGAFSDVIQKLIAIQWRDHNGFEKAISKLNMQTIQ